MDMTGPAIEISPAVPACTEPEGARPSRQSTPLPTRDGLVCALARKLDGFAPLTV